MKFEGNILYVAIFFFGVLFGSTAATFVPRNPFSHYHHHRASANVKKYNGQAYKGNSRSMTCS